MYIHTCTRGCIVARTGRDIIPWKARPGCMHGLRARVRGRGGRGATRRARANPIRWVSGTNGGSMFYRYCSRRATDTSRVGRRAYIARAFSRLLQDLWISVCLSPNLSCPPLRAPGIIFLRRTVARGRVEARWVTERRKKEIFFFRLFPFAFALRCRSLIGEVNIHWWRSIWMDVCGLLLIVFGTCFLKVI